jgi:hypothetical protein
MNKGVEMYKEKARTRKSVNPFTIKKGFYISELNIGIDGLESDSDIAGPFINLERARAVFKKIVTEDKYRNKAQIVHNYAIKGPAHTPKDTSMFHSPTTPWYHFEKTWREE